MSLRLMLWMTVAILCGFGLVVVVSATAGMTGSNATGTVTYAFLWKQMLAMAGGIAGAVAISWWVGTDRLRSTGWTALALAATVLSLLAVLAVGRTVNGAKRWIDLGPVNLQPAELAKLSVVLAAAWYFARYPHLTRTFWHGTLRPLLGFGVVAGLVYATKDLGSVVVMGVVFSVILWYAGTRMVPYLLLVVAALPILFYTAAWSVGYRRDRMLSFMDPLNSDGPTAYHLKQGFIAMGGGGLWGTGLGQGTAKLGFVPEKHTDFIFAVICEEFGMVGGTGLAALYLLFIGIGLRIAATSRDLHRRLLAVGCTTVIGFQAFGNMLVVTGCVPTKGMTLPFISYGGTSVAVCIVFAGILDAVAKANARDRLDGGVGTSATRGAVIKTHKTLSWSHGTTTNLGSS